MIRSFVSRFESYLKNISWILSEKVLRILAGLFIGVFVARHLGPEQFGSLNYALALSSFFAVATHMGLSGLVVRELVKKPSDAGLTMGTTFHIKAIMSVLTCLLFLVVATVTEQFASTEYWLLVLVSASILLKPIEVLNFWFESKVQSRYSSLANMITLASSSLLKIALVLFGAQLLSFAMVHVFEVLLVSLLIVYFYKSSSSVPFKEWNSSKEKAKIFLSQSWMILLGALFATVYLKVDQVMLKWLVSKQEVGIYAVAARLSEIWYFVPTAIVSSFFPRLIALKENQPEQYLKRLQMLFDLLFVMAFILAIVVTLFSDPIISLLYGPAYHKSSSVLAIHIWAGVFIFMRAALSKWILTENLLEFSLITQASGAIFNVALNLLLIPRYQSTGAAAATLISYGIASYFSLMIYKKSRSVFFMITKSFFAPLRLTLNLAKDYWWEKQKTSA